MLSGNVAIWKKPNKQQFLELFSSIFENGILGFFFKFSYKPLRSERNMNTSDFWRKERIPHDLLLVGQTRS